jgi:HK97 family phage prohead protease
MTTATTVQLLGADPITHDALAARIANPTAKPGGATWADRLVVGAEFRDLDLTTEDGFTVLRGKAVPYGEWASIGYFLEAFERGSMSKSITEASKAGRDLPLNLFHDNRSFPIGAASKWDEETNGLVGTWRIDKSERAQEAARLADDGLLTGLSIEFQPVRSTWEFVEDWNPSLGPDFMDKCTRVEARLGAVGLVQTPAYVSAGVDLVRSADARRRGQLEAEQRSAPGLTEWKAELDRIREGA